MVLLQRVAKDNLRRKIEQYCEREKFDQIPHNIVVKKVSSQKEKKEILQDINNYATYCLQNTANLDDNY